MNLQHIILINGRLHEIRAAIGSCLVLNAGKQFAVANTANNKMTHKHALTGRFRSTKIRQEET